MIIIDAISWFPTLLWVALAGLILYWGFSSRAREARGCLVAAIAGGLLFLLLASTFLRASVVFVEPTERGVVISGLDEGVRADALQPGLNLVVPFLEDVILYPITRQTYTMSIVPQEGQIHGDDFVAARTSDGQVVGVEASVIFSIDPGRVVGTYIKWRDQYINSLIRPQARGIIRDAVSQFVAEELYTARSASL